jgi:hypothetical protein
MMILVIGNDPQRVDLSDIGDVVYYRQQKFFSDSQLSRSVDLRKALKSGRLSKLQEYGAVDQEFVLPGTVPMKSPTKESSKLDLLLEKLSAMEKNISSGQAPAQPDGAVVDVLLDRISKLEQKIADLSKGGGDTSLTEAVRQLAEKVDSSTKDTSILDRLESILEKAGSSGSGTAAAYEPTRPEEVYVPTVSVEDGNTHIKLDVRALESPAGDLDASLAALKKMKSQK